MKHKLFILTLLAIIPIISGCGTSDSVGGSGQCGGVAESGLCTKITSLAAETTKNVDISRIPDCDGDVTTDDPETFTDHNASVTITATLMSTYTSPAAAEFVTFTRYSVDYSLSSGYSYAVTPPTIASKEYHETLQINKNGSGTLSLRFMDLQLKSDLLTAFTNNGWTGNELPSYTATYTFYGTDDRNRSLKVSGYFTFTIGSYNNC